MTTGFFSLFPGDVFANGGFEFSPVLQIAHPLAGFFCFLSPGHL